MLSSPIEEIKNRLDIVDVIKSYIKIEKAGANYRAVCPFHSEKKPSFFISPARQIWHCFGSCSDGGDMFRFIMKVEGVEFGDALRMLAQKAGVELTKQDPKLKTQRERLYGITELACKFFQAQLGQSLAGKEAKDYLLKRGINEESIKEWRIGYAPDAWQGLSDFLVSRGFTRDELEKSGLALKSHKTGRHYDRFRGRIIFPIFDLSSQPVGFGGRVFKQTKRYNDQEEAKYINSPATFLYDKSKILYGLNRSGIGIRKNNVCVLVEGYTDVILAHQAGFNNVVATSGTALTEYQLKILKRYSDNLLTAFDMDLAGNSATKRGIDLAQILGFNIRIVVMPQDSDPADVVSSNPEQWKSLIKNSKTIHDFYFETTFAKFDKNTMEGKKEISKTLLPIIKKIPNRIEQTLWIKSLSEKLGVGENDINEELGKVKLDPIRNEVEAVKRQNPVSRSRKELVEERLLVLLLRLFKNIEIIEEKDLKFFSQQTCSILQTAKEKGSGFETSLANEHKDYLNPLLLKAELEQNKEKDCQDEFKNCVLQIKTLVIKDKLDQISKEIRMAEQEHNSAKVQELTQEFNNYSKSRSNLEI